MTKVCLLLVSAAALMGAAHATEPLADDELARLSAGTETTTTTQQIVTATNGGNLVIADQVTTGTINFADGAFAGFNGIGNVVVNSGNNNIIQGTLSVTVVTPPSM